MLTAISFAAGYTIGPATTPQQSRSPAVTMAGEYRLNNYILDKPVEPLNNQVLVKLRKVSEQTGGGLFVPTGETEKVKEGVVVAAGPGRQHPETGKLLPCPVKEGELVLLSDFVGEKVEYNGEKHMFVDGDTLLGSYENKEMTVGAFKPLGDRVMVEIEGKPSETTTGIALALDDDDDPNQGTVVAVGPGKPQPSGEIKPVGIATGENIMFARYVGTEHELEGKRFKIVDEGDCLAKW